MATAALIAVAWDLYLKKVVHRAGVAARKLIQTFRGRATRAQAHSPDQELQPNEDHEMVTPAEQGQHDTDDRSSRDEDRDKVTLRPGLSIITLFFAIFTAVMVLRSVYKTLIPLRLLGNMMLAGTLYSCGSSYTISYFQGTIIFGGGLVVVPLLREYVVQEGWVTLRDLLIGLAVIQAFPRPNFNCSASFVDTSPSHPFSSCYMPWCIYCIIGRNRLVDYRAHHVCSHFLSGVSSSYGNEPRMQIPETISSSYLYTEGRQCGNRRIGVDSCVQAVGSWKP
jgi:hypothetical protein